MRREHIFSAMQMESQADLEFVEFIIKHIVNNPDDVQISRKTDEMGVLLEVKVNQSDMGLLIGRSGSTAKAIRVLARIIGMKNNARVNLRIIEPEGSTHGQDGGSEAMPPEDRTNRNLDDVVKELGM
jgi:predicted RNA-binding protein YlqC (UPF0109 family)